MRKEIERGLLKVMEGLRECGLDEKEIEGLVNFLRIYLELEKGE